MKRQPAVVVDENAGYRQKLLSRRDEVLSGLGVKFDTLARMGRVAEDDQAQITHDEFVSLRLNRLDYGQLRLIEEALDRMECGEYGVCICCEEPIPAKRLRALPWARCCVACEEALAAESGLDWMEEVPRTPVS